MKTLRKGIFNACSVRFEVFSWVVVWFLPCTRCCRGEKGGQGSSACAPVKRKKETIPNLGSRALLAFWQIWWNSQTFQEEDYKTKIKLFVMPYVENTSTSGSYLEFTQVRQHSVKFSTKNERFKRTISFHRWWWIDVKENLNIRRTSSKRATQWLKIFRIERCINV